MKVNNILLSKYNATQLMCDISPSDISNTSEWIEGSLLPVFRENKISFKDISLELYFEGNSRSEIAKNISNFLSLCRNVIELRVDGYENIFKCILSKRSIKKMEVNSDYRLNLSFIGYEHGEEVIIDANRVQETIINNEGNNKTPIIMELLPSVASADLTISGLTDDPFIIKNLVQGKKITINSEVGTITQEGINKFGDFETWEFPFLVPGENRITISKSICDIRVKYKPMYE